MTLREQARKMANDYKHNPKLEVVFLGGSVSKGWEDQFSDIELFLLWKEPPLDEDRLEPINRVGGKIINFHPYEDLEWSESYIVDGTKFEISSFLMETVDQFIEELKLGDLSMTKQCLIAAIADGKPYKGEEMFNQKVKEIYPYPQRLKARLIERAFEFGGPWQNREALVHRDDSLFLQKTIIDVCSKNLIALHALNDTYIHHPGLKWLSETVDRMVLKPNCYVERITEIVTSPDKKNSVKKLEVLIQETGKLIEDHIPQIHLTEQLKRACMLRHSVKSE
ncbi:cytoplasmic protein [Pseudalkalibacillus berkeleyi]|uniref:Cytoplasmic protein n=1 Tax=Pseudalkalibacillus berkeleyi TaxID=1069813 RepID=A0ABS9H4W2_9BACL|nr:cytoplasmic protein [Pseudalkalibacillus berkeleyi]MCF6139005.1 cytoplasmic protein [Pseudalkalibacillus berkeleyi]